MDGFEGVAAGAGICTVGFFTAVIVFAGKDALTLLDEAWTAVVGSVGILWGTEPSASGAGVRRFPRGRPEGGGLPALGGFAILGFTPLFRHINEIRDRGGYSTICPAQTLGTVWQRCQSRAALVEISAGSPCFCSD